MLVKDIIAREKRNQNLSTAQLAEMLGVNKGTINRYENGSIKVIPVDTLKRLSSIFGYSFDDFVGGDPKYSYLADKPQKTNNQQNEEDQLILDWFHCLPDRHKEFLKEIAAHSDY